jgi:hypothetical protein
MAIYRNKCLYIETFYTGARPVNNMLGAGRMKIIGILIICLLFLGCSENHRDLSEYDLDINSFDSEAMAKIERESGIKIPDGSKGIAFHHIPPVDPIVYAKIEIPADAQELIKNQINKFTYSGNDFPKDFANNKCKWWSVKPKNVVLSKQAFNNGYYIELYLVKEESDTVLYIKYFTV